MAKASFINRLGTGGYGSNIEPETKDYISIVNDTIRRGGTIDVNSETYQRAVEQFNGTLLKGSITRLEVPRGFCGYIDPTSGQFRVEPIDIDSNLRSSTLYPNNATSPSAVPDVPPIPWPIDQCLKLGLPGSYEYSTGECGVEDGDNACSGIKWFSGGSWPEEPEEGEGEGSGGGTEGGGTRAASTGDIQIYSEDGDLIETKQVDGMELSVDPYVDETSSGNQFHASWRLGNLFPISTYTYFFGGRKKKKSSGGGTTGEEEGEGEEIEGADLQAMYDAIKNTEVCGGGPGINSNTGLASSDLLGGATGNVPQGVLAKATAIARAKYKTAVYCKSVTSGVVGEARTYDIFFTVYQLDIPDPAYLRPCGYMVRIITNASGAIVGNATEQLF